MYIFNAFQLVLLFAAGPFLITYVKDADFYAHHVLFFALIFSYIGGFAAITLCVAGEMKNS
jgi:hypothetical protein